MGESSRCGVRRRGDGVLDFAHGRSQGKARRTFFFAALRLCGGEHMGRVEKHTASENVGQVPCPDCM